MKNVAEEQANAIVQRQYFEHPRSRLHQRRVDTPALPPEHSQTSVDPLNIREGESDENEQGQNLSPLLLLGLMYTYAIGGAYGVEESVMGGGPFLTIIGILLIPVFVGLPTALVVTELASSIPSNAAFLMWINVSFHPVIYFAMVIISMLFTFIDNALFPVLISEYLCTSFTCSNVVTKSLRVALLVVTYALNMIGIQAVGKTSVLLTIFTVLPFLVMFLTHLFRTNFYLNWPAISDIPSNINWATFITTVSWNLSGLEQAGTVAEDIKRPQRTIIRALISLMGLAYVTYVPPIMTGASVQKGTADYSQWTTGYWLVVADAVGGTPLRVLIIIGSVLSAFGQTMSALCTTTQIIAGVALTEAFPGVLNRILTQRNKRFGTYHWALTINTVVTGLFCTLLDFGPLVKIDQVLYGIRVVMVFLSFLILRYRYPYLARPFKVPLSGYKLAIFVFPILFFSALMTIALIEDTQTVILTVSVLGSSVLLSLLYCFAVRKEGFHGRVVTAELTSPGSE